MRAALSILSALLVGGPASAQGVSGYHIGNSLTWDSRPRDLREGAASFGIDLAVGHHIYCNRSLDLIWANPDSVCVDPDPAFGTFVNALLRVNLDYVSFQPFPTGSSTLGSDNQVISDMCQVLSMNTEGAAPVVFVYQTWGSASFMSGPAFHAPVADEDDTPTTFADEYFRHLYDRIDADVPFETRLVPTGRVIDRVADQIAAGEIAGVDSVQELYRDSVHLSHGLGRFISWATNVSVVLDRPPFGLGRVWVDLANQDGPYPASTYVALERAIWDVVSADSRTGVSPWLSDTNRDGCVTPADLNEFFRAYGFGWGTADQNRDGQVTPSDFNSWILNYGVESPLAGGC